MSLSRKEPHYDEGKAVVVSNLIVQERVRQGEPCANKSSCSMFVGKL